MQPKHPCVYILSNRRLTVLYIGVTADLPNRMAAHGNGKGSKFCAKYQVRHLLYMEAFPTMAQAIAREKQLKNWHSDWKWQLIASANPLFNDLMTGEALGKVTPDDRNSAGDPESSSG